MPLTSSATAALVAILIITLSSATPIEPSLVTTLTRRDQVVVAGLPACNTKDTDPTWAQGQSKFKEADGVKISDDCDNGLDGNDHCWTDYVLVDYINSAGPWYSPFGQINCPGDTATPASMCNQQIGQMKQDADTCKTTSWTVGGKVGLEIQGKIKDVIGLTFAPEVNGDKGGTATTCNTNVTTETCQWPGGTGCHQAWASQVIVTVRGFKRRSCQTATTDPAANMPNMAQRGFDGKYTRGMQDFELQLASANTINCDGGCQPVNPDPLPNQGSGPIPWPHM